MSKAQKHSRIWDSSNISESFPGIVKPLTFSIARRGYELVYKSQAYEAGLDWYSLEANHRTVNAMVGIFGGRMYYNLINWYKFIGLFPNNRQNQKYLDEQLQTVGDAIYLPPQYYSLRYRIKYWLRIARRAVFFEHERKQYWQYLEKNFQLYELLDKEKDPFLQLERYAFLEQMIVPHMGRAVDNDFFVMSYHGILKKKLTSWLGSSTEAKHDFLGSLHDVVSARQPTLLIEIADSINKDPYALSLMNNDAFKKLDGYLSTTPTAELLVEYREKFLHRFAEDQKIEAKNPMLELSGFYAMIKTYQQLNIVEIKQRKIRATAKELERSKSITNKLSFIRRAKFRFLLSRLKHHLRVREHNRLLRGKVYALLRELFIDMGATLAQQGLLNESEDIYYLEIDELFQMIDGSGHGGNFKKLVSERKALYIQFMQIKAPVRFMTRGIITELPAAFTLRHQSRKYELNRTLRGTIASPGKVEGIVIVLDEPVIPSEPFDILVVNHTDPGWTPLIALAKGLIVEHGGILSHAAIVTRELGIPSIIGIEGVTTKLKTGQRVRLDANKGIVEKL